MSYWDRQHVFQVVAFLNGTCGPSVVWPSGNYQIYLVFAWPSLLVYGTHLSPSPQPPSPPLWVASLTFNKRLHLVFKNHPYSTLFILL